MLQNQTLNIPSNWILKKCSISQNWIKKFWKYSTKGRPLYFFCPVLLPTKGGKPEYTANRYWNYSRIYKILKSYDTTKSKGPSVIPNEILKNCCQSMSYVFHILFSEIIKFKKLPEKNENISNHTCIKSCKKQEYDLFL
jgi:hypothetical protein